MVGWPGHIGNVHSAYAKEPLMENAALFQTIIERGFNQGDVSVADEVCAAKLMEHEYLAPTDLPGPD
jgi:hypothetical protein